MKGRKDFCMKKTVTIIVIIAVVLSLGGIAVYAALSKNDSSPVSLDLTLNAIKVNDDGENLGTVQIKLTASGNRNPQPHDPMTVEIEPFDGYDWIQFANTYGGLRDENGIVQGTYVQYAPAKAYMEDPDAFYVMPISLKYYTMAYNYLGFTPDYQRWIIRDIESGVSYLASTNENDTLEDLLEQFDHLRRVDLASKED